ncbi:MAG: lysylphosphatidylglycerol synthase transmembrane domain-containing protein [Bacteroidota bacterium]
MPDSSTITPRKSFFRSKKSELIPFVLGLCVLAYLVYRFGFSTLLSNLIATGWTFGLIIGLWLFIYILNTTAWRLALGPDGERISSPRLFQITVSGFALNDMTPFLAIGGEPYRISVLSELLGRDKSVSAVTLYRMIFSLGHLLFLLVGILAVLVALELPPSVKLPLAAIGLILVAIISILISGHRGGVFERIHGRVQRWRVLGRLLKRIPVNQESLRQMDELIMNVYHKRKKNFYGAIGCEFFSRCCMSLEIFLILRSIGLPVDLAQAFFLFLTFSILINLFFAVPYNLGVREGGFYFALESLALPPMIGVYLGIVMRIREFFWYFVGLSFIALAGLRKPKTT